MATFYTVTSGATTLAADVNQYANILNATTSGNISIVYTVGGFGNRAINTELLTAPASDQDMIGSFVSSDAQVRIGTYIRGSDGYGGLRGGAGPSLTSHLYTQATGWKIDESLTITTNLTVNGATSVQAFTASGATNINSTLSVTGITSLDTSKLTTDGNGGLIFSGRLGKASTGDLIDGSGLFTYIKAGGSGQRIRFQPNPGTTIAAFIDGGSYNLIVDGGFQFGSGGADDAELEWSEYDDATTGAVLPAAEVVCWTEDAGYGGHLTRCSHDDCCAAGIISTRPASVKGGRMIEVQEIGPDGEPVNEREYDSDPRWRPLALEGRVPVRLSTLCHKQDFAIGQRVVSAGDGGVRPCIDDIDTSPLGFITSLVSNVDGAALAENQVLVLVR